jgi:hypothetical protein
MQSTDNRRLSMLKGQASMIDILLLAVFITIVLVGSSAFAGSEQQRAEQAREEAGYAQAQLITTLEYQDPAWNNQTTAQRLNYMFCTNGLPSPPSSCAPVAPVQLTLQNILNKTARSGYNYIFYAESVPLNFTICDRQISVCSKNLPSIAHTQHEVVCPDGYGKLVDYYVGIWPAWQDLPLAC